MCARYGFMAIRDRILDLFGVDGAWPDLPVIAPTNDVPVVSADAGGRVLRFCRWGLVPVWTDDPKETGHINARGESLFERRTFREASRTRRCLLPATWFFEWGGPPGARQAYRFELDDGAPFAFAGIWEPPAPNRREATCALVTTAANELVAQIHDRMPVILPPDVHDLWLDPEATNADTLGAVLRPYAAERMRRREASREETLPPKAPKRLSQATLFDL